MQDSKADELNKAELAVPESDTKNLSIIDRSDMVFAVIYAVLFLWGVLLTVLAI